MAKFNVRLRWCSWLSRDAYILLFFGKAVYNLNVGSSSLPRRNLFAHAAPVYFCCTHEAFVVLEFFAANRLEKREVALSHACIGTRNTNLTFFRFGSVEVDGSKQHLEVVR